ncbi:TPA: phosphatidylinositol kinase [Staphylococcus delphini]|nr:phosphatidylinositol kinase [Staphylococcus delphini]HEC2148407.1 phosphatidylinositol kinase [Staphylococcus delphini]HEC2177938.1 phosphatidylinositol kinase [Staphylococcus delphini]HEC2193249.1 phosphatidylinositol kinase [Staphylococcus delphini]HEC2195298.1 phosphatidylinositol kinase [Staphylococcus delphini]
MLKELTEITSFVGINFSTDPLYAKIENTVVIAKHIDNPQGHYVLFNVCMGYALAKKMKIPTPEFGCAIFIAGKTINYIASEYRINHNDLFTYTVMENSVVPIESPMLTMSIGEEEIVKLIIFDVIITNLDRNKGNLLIKMPKKGEEPRLFPIDYTHIFPGQCIWFDVLKRPFPSTKKIVEQIFEHGGHQNLIENRNFDAMLIDEVAREFKVKLQDIDISSIIESIPQILLSRFEKNDIENLKKYLTRNIEEYDDIIKEIKQYLVR